MHDNEGGSKGKTGDRGAQQGTSNRPGDAEKRPRHGGKDDEDEGMDAAKGSRSGDESETGSRSGNQGESRKGGSSGNRGKKGQQGGNR